MNEATLKAVNDLAEKLGATGGHLLEIYTRKVMLEGITDMVFAMFCGAILWFGIWRRLFPKAAKSDDPEVTIAMVVLLAIFVAGVALTCLYCAFFELAIPQGVALERIIGANK